MKGLNEKNIFKGVLVLVASFLGGINFICLYKIGKQVNSVLLKVTSITLAVVAFVCILFISFVESETPILDAVIPVLCFALICPTILSLINIKKYLLSCSYDENKINTTHTKQPRISQSNLKNKSHIKEEEDISYDNSIGNESDKIVAEYIDIRNIHTHNGYCNVKGKLDNFIVTVYVNNKRFNFNVVDGQIVSFKTAYKDVPEIYNEVG